MLMSIIKTLVLLFICGLVYWVLSQVVSFTRAFMPVSFAEEAVVYFLWSLVPIIIFIGRAREIWLARKVVED